MRIDTHSHFVTPSYLPGLEAHSHLHPELAELSAALIGPLAAAGLMDLDARVAAMDEVEMDVSVLSLPPPSTYFDDADLAATTASRVNDEFIAAAEGFPGRFAVLACLPLPHVDEAVLELERVASHPLVRGLALVTTLEDWSLDQPRFLPIFQLAAEHDLAVQLHPAMETMHWALRDWGLNAAFGTLASSTTTVARMTLSGLFDRVPNLVPIVPHLGGTIPFVAARISEMGQGTAEHDLLYHCRSTLYFDNCSFFPPALRATIDVAGADRIMLGSDYPGRGPLQRCIQDVIDSGLSATDQQRILGETAAQWFALDGSSTSTTAVDSSISSQL